jgi:hypothetical protein
MTTDTIIKAGSEQTRAAFYDHLPDVMLVSKLRRKWPSPSLVKTVPQGHRSGTVTLDPHNAGPALVSKLLPDAGIFGIRHFPLHTLFNDEGH